LPKPLDRIELGAVRGKKRQFDIARHLKLLRLMKLAVIQNEDVVASGKRLRKSVKKDLETVAIEALVLGEKALAGFRFDRAELQGYRICEE